MKRKRKHTHTQIHTQKLHIHTHTDLDRVFLRSGFRVLQKKSPNLLNTENTRERERETWSVRASSSPFDLDLLLLPRMRVSHVLRLLRSSFSESPLSLVNVEMVGNGWPFEFIVTRLGATRYLFNP